MIILMNYFPLKNVDVCSDVTCQLADIGSPVPDISVSVLCWYVNILEDGPLCPVCENSWS